MKRTGRNIRCYQITSEGITTGWMLKEEWLNSVQDYLIQEWQEEMTWIIDLLDKVNDIELYSDEDWDEQMIILEEAKKFTLGEELRLMQNIPLRVDDEKWFSSEKIEDEYEDNVPNSEEEVEFESEESVEEEEKIKMVWLPPESLDSDVASRLYADICNSCTSNQDWIRMLRSNGFISVPSSEIEDEN
jgi:hypothetical protein